MIITKERNTAANQRKEFPQLILEDDNVSKNEIQRSEETTLSKKEIVTFLCFTILYILVVTL